MTRPAGAVSNPTMIKNALSRCLPVAGIALAALSMSIGHAQPVSTPSAQDPIPKYTIFRASTPLTIDGQLDELEWFAAPAVGDFVFPWWKDGRKEQTSAKLLWDDEYLYLAFVCEDAHITARHTERDGKIPEDDCVELMITPDADRPHKYFNIEFNVIGGIIDNFRPDGPAKPRAPKWDAEGVKIAGSFAGTLNDDTDVDRHWLVEVAIPWSNFEGHAQAVPPHPSTVIRFNLNRSGGQTNRQYSQWASGNTPRPAFHTPDRFGRGVLERRAVPFAGTRLPH